MYDVERWQYDLLAALEKDNTNDMALEDSLSIDDFNYLNCFENSKLCLLSVFMRFKKKCHRVHASCLAPAALNINTTGVTYPVI